MALIETKDVLNAIDECENIAKEKGEIETLIGVAVLKTVLGALFDGLPEADPVHEAGGCRCKECKYSYTRMVDGFYGKYQERRCENEDAPWCGNEFATIVEDDDFCSYGRRREEE